MMNQKHPVEMPGRVLIENINVALRKMNAKVEEVRAEKGVSPAAVEDVRGIAVNAKSVADDAKSSAFSIQAALLEQIKALEARIIALEQNKAISLNEQPVSENL